MKRAPQRILANRGAGLLEFALLIGIVALAAISAIEVFGGDVKHQYCGVNHQLRDGGTSGSGLPGDGSFEYECGLPPNTDD
ncbi:MAG: hypothetical protein QY326_07580 [Bdellovibrionota bacterium]|nr:MAG: hypothetical protein QY326_07580 [Bdellovibrionota bacterium]